MNISHHTEIELQTVDMEGSANAKVRWLVGAKQGAENFAMRMFEIGPGGHTPLHQHDYEHEIYVLEGSGVAVDGQQEHPLQPGDVIHVRPNDVHQFRNVGSDTMKMLCLIPNSATGKQVTVVPECGLEPSS